MVGGGFGGLRVARGLRRAAVDVTLVDRRNFHLFQPLLYQVATGALAQSEIASPLRGIFKRQRNVRVLLGDVHGFDLERRLVLLHWPERGGGEELPYDVLVVAAGARHSYFQHPEWQQLAPGPKTLEEAVEIRRRILLAFEAAETETDAERRRAWLTFVVVGGGPTGVEMAGQIAEIAHETLRRDFRTIDPRSADVQLIELGERILPAFPPQLSAKAMKALEKLGVTSLVGNVVTAIDPESVMIRDSAGAERTIATRTVVWAAGVAASELGAVLADATGSQLDRSGRVAVGPDLTLPGHPEVFVLGDMVVVHGADGRPLPLPGVAPTAMQQGRYIARLLRRDVPAQDRPPFRYVDKGNLATIGRGKAVADIKGLKLSGTIAWLTWLFVHLLYLVGLENRLLVFIRWTISFVTHGRGARLISEADGNAS
ncbi:MAG: NAD(P)/FAD-dependent oxidoreductase [Gaiellaceae bacterium]